MYRNNNKVSAPFQFKSPVAQQLMSGSGHEMAPSNVMRRKMWPLAVLLLLILLIAVCTLPWVSRIDHTMEGAEVSIDGTVIASGELTLRGRSLNYLLRQDQFKLQGLQVPNREIGKIMDQAFPVWEFDSLYLTRVWLELSEYTSEHNFYICNLIFPKDHSWYVLQITDRFFIGSAGQYTDFIAIMEMCRPLLNG